MTRVTGDAIFASRKGSGAQSVEWDAVLVGVQPLGEGLQLWVERPGERDVPRAAVFVVEVPLDLKHVAHVIGTGETETPADVGIDRLVSHRAPERLRERGRHLVAGQVLAGHSDGAVDQLLPEWFLLAGALRPVVELQGLRWRRGARDSDADQLARLTWLPGLLWVGFFGLVTIAVLVLAVSLLLVPARTDLLDQ